MNHENISNYNELIKHDLTAWFTVVVISNIVLCNYQNKQPFDNEWLFYSIASLLGLSIHSILTNKITIHLINKLNIKKRGVKLAIVDSIKWITVYTINNMLFTYLKHKKIIYNNEWFKLYGGIILGYIIFDLLFEEEIYNLTKNNKKFSINVFKSAIGIFVGYYLSYGHVHIDFLHAVISIEISLIIYYLIINKFIPPLLL